MDVHELSLLDYLPTNSGYLRVEIRKMKFGSGDLFESGILIDALQYSLFILLLFIWLFMYKRTPTFATF